MNLNDFAYLVETEKSFDEAVVSVLKAVEQKGRALFQVNLSRLSRPRHSKKTRSSSP